MTAADSATPRTEERPPERTGRRGRIPSEGWNVLGEEFRSLRTRVAGAMDQRHKVILVTSALPEEGKTTVSTNLARSFSQMEWRTILVDGDLRKPDLHARFGLVREPGLTDLLEGRGGEDEAIAMTDHPHLDVLSAGTPSTGPAELLQGEAMPRILRGLAARYDYVVVDSPPLTAVTDAHLLSGYADAILIVVKGLASPREMVRDAVGLLQGRPVLGVVLNGISIPKKYGYYY
jgi:capsular exopolysaccharide synthesis family protein